MNSLPANPIHKNKALPRTKQDFTSYKDFNSEVSLGSEDFEDSFGDLNNSFGSSDEERAGSILMNFEEKEAANPVVKNKEEETNYTAKIPFIMDKEEVKKSIWCGGCMFKTSENGNCLIF